MTDRDKETELFLRALKLEGVEEIYLPKKEGSKNQAQESPTAESAPSSGTARDQLIQLRQKALKCTLCHELASTRKSVVFGAGNVKADLMFIGEAPGRDEDLQGLPFVGRAGQLLTKIIESIGLTRKQVFIANVLKCRPPGNRAPQPEEVLNCAPFLQKQIELIQPKIICALGSHAAQALLKTGEPISKLRGKFMDYPGNFTVKVICTFHPAYLLRNPSAKKEVWIDMKKIKRELEASE